MRRAAPLTGTLAGERAAKTLEVYVTKPLADRQLRGARVRPETETAQAELWLKEPAARMRRGLCGGGGIPTRPRCKAAPLCVDATDGYMEKLPGGIQGELAIHAS